MLAISLITRDGGEALLRRLIDTSPAALLSTDAEGNTLLHHAMRCGRLELASELVERGLDPSTTNAAGQRPVDVMADAHPLLFGGENSPLRRWNEQGGGAEAMGPSRGGRLRMESSGCAEHTGGTNQQLQVAHNIAECERTDVEMQAVGPPPPLTFSTLPDDATIEITKHLNLADVLSLSETSRHFHSLRDSPTLWEHLCWVHLKKHLGDRQSCLVSYRDIYIEHTILQGGIKMLAKQREEAKGRGEHVRRHMSSSIEELFSH
mmetsp:Transcript_16185/g.49161  ORF Transcript_16185/g.49161 Transcript_16185/m.49161 type:complete len:263 (+) Transcript_16185:207-995(+)